MRDRGTLTRSAGLVAWTVALGGAIWLLTRMGTGSLAAPPLGSPDELRSWADDRDAAEIVMAVVRLLALAMAWYLIALTVAGALARLTRSARVTATTDRLTPPWMRSLLDHAVGIGLTGTAMLGAFAPSIADDPSSEVELAGDQQAAAESSASQTRLDGRATQRLLPDSFQPASTLHLGSAGGVDSAPEATPAAAPGPDHWTIEAGDHLWKVAAETLGEERGRPMTDAEIDPYWRALIELNRDVLVDRDDPDLVYPGQVFELPPID